MSLNKFSDVDTGYTLNLDIGADEIKANQISTTNIDVTTINGAPYIPGGGGGGVTNPLSANLQLGGFSIIEPLASASPSLNIDQLDPAKKIDLKVGGVAKVEVKSGEVELKEKLNMGQKLIENVGGIINASAPTGVSGTVTSIGESTTNMSQTFTSNKASIQQLGNEIIRFEPTLVTASKDIDMTSNSIRSVSRIQSQSGANLIEFDSGASNELALISAQTRVGDSSISGNELFIDSNVARLTGSTSIDLLASVVNCGAPLDMKDNEILNGEVDTIQLIDLKNSILRINDSLQTLTNTIIPTTEVEYKYDSKEASDIKADAAPPVMNPVDSGLGWYYTNSSSTAPTNKINWYFVGDSPTRRLGGLRFIASRVKIYNNSSLAVLPFYNVYTKPQGDGKDAASWYRSRQTYTVKSADQPSISNGDTVLLVAGTDPSGSETDITHYTLELDFTTVGPQQPDEEIFLIAFSTGSSAPTNQVQLALTKFISSFDGLTQVVETTG